MSVQRIINDVNPRLMNILKKSNVKVSQQVNYSETFRNGIRLTTSADGKIQDVRNSNGDLLFSQIEDSRRKSYII